MTRHQTLGDNSSPGENQTAIFPEVSLSLTAERFKNSLFSKRYK